MAKRKTTKTNKTTQAKSKRAPAIPPVMQDVVDGFHLPAPDEALPAPVVLTDIRIRPFTGERLGVLLRKLADGVPLAHAAHLSGIRKDYVTELRARSPQFAALFELARARFVDRNIQAIYADPKSWTRHAWLLERSLPDEFGWRTMLRIREDDMRVLDRLGISPQAAWAAVMDGLRRRLAALDNTRPEALEVKHGD